MHMLLRLGTAAAFAGLLLLVAIPHGQAQSASPLPAPPHADLTIIHPVQSCEALAQADLAGTPVTMEAALATSPRGEFCRVTGTIAPAIGLEVDLPTIK